MKFISKQNHRKKNHPEIFHRLSLKTAIEPSLHPTLKNTTHYAKLIARSEKHLYFHQYLKKLRIEPDRIKLFTLTHHQNYHHCLMIMNNLPKKIFRNRCKTPRVVQHSQFASLKLHLQVPTMQGTGKARTIA